MLRRLAVVLVSLSAAACFTAGTATAASFDDPRELTPREQAGLEFAGHVLGGLLGGSPLRGAGF
ncbi:hypothetical protein AB0G73_29635 [Streptomyces sp. NPDC020719]|uniref:hypothetical protein n=1 Tax=unclassified Streptomyces TaxID=2593676 RepID=UPI0033F2EBE8